MRPTKKKMYALTAQLDVGGQHCRGRREMYSAGRLFLDSSLLSKVERTSVNEGLVVMTHNSVLTICSLLYLITVNAWIKVQGVSFENKLPATICVFCPLKEFEIELEGSQTLRLLCYEKCYNKTKQNKEDGESTDRIMGKGQILVRHDVTPSSSRPTTTHYTTELEIHIRAQ